MEAYDQDGLNYHGALRVSFAMQMMGAVDRIQRAVPSVAWPFLLLQGDNDKLCDIGGARLMFEQAASADKKLKVRWGGGFTVLGLEACLLKSDLIVINHPFSAHWH